MKFSGLVGQSAVEYIFTYGWMLVVISLTGGTIFSLASNQNIESVNGFNSQKLTVEDFGVSKEDGLMFSMSDPTGQTEISKIIVRNPNNSVITYINNQDVSEENHISLPGITPGNQNNLEVEITYKSGKLENLTTTGTITGTLELDQSLNGESLILDGLIGYWPLSQKYLDGRTTYDLSSNNNHGISTRTSFTNDPYLGSSAEFNGSNNNLISMSNDNRLKQKDDLSVGAWFRPEKSQPRGHAVAIHQGKYSNLYGYAIIISDSGQATFSVGEGKEFGGVGVSTEAPVEEPTHIMGVYGDGKISIFQNGTLKESKQIDFKPQYRDEGFMLGRRADWWTRFYSGKMSEVMVYDRGLSEEEIMTIYQ